MGQFQTTEKSKAGLDRVITEVHIEKALQCSEE